MDSAYEGDETLRLARQLGYTPIVPPNPNRLKPWELDRIAYRRRNEIERLFRRLKSYRRVFCRFDKLDVLFTGLIVLRSLSKLYTLVLTGPNQTCGHSIFLCRQLDGINFFSANDDGDGSEGFVIEFGSYGLIRSFSLCWSEVERFKSEQTASIQEIIHCIRAHKTIVMPNVGEENYFAILKNLTAVKNLTITKITPCYGEGVFGEVPTNDVPCKFVTPFAELEAVADFGNSNTTVRLASPILSSEVSRLLAK